jgi:hypothetical protein
MAVPSKVLTAKSRPFFTLAARRSSSRASASAPTMIHRLRLTRRAVFAVARVQTNHSANGATTAV